MHLTQQLLFFFYPLSHAHLVCLFRFFEEYQVDRANHIHVRSIYPYSIRTAKCCPNRPCYLSFAGSNGAVGFNPGIPSPHKYEEIILQETNNCYRDSTDNVLYKYYEPILVELSHSCHCTYPPPIHGSGTNTPPPDM